MRQINGDSLCLSTYQYLKRNEEWVKRYEDLLKGKRSLPLLYDPFFKKIFNPVERRDRLSELVSCLLGQKVTVLEVFPNEDSQFLGVMIIMDMDSKAQYSVMLQLCQRNLIIIYLKKFQGEYTSRLRIMMARYLLLQTELQCTIRRFL